MDEVVDARPGRQAQRGDEQWLLGLGGSSHDFSVALMRGTDIHLAIESERISRVKYGVPPFLFDPYRECVDYCLGVAEIDRDSISKVVSSDLLPERTLAEWSVKTFPHHLCHAASAVMLLDPEVHACVLVFDGNGSAKEPLEEAGGSQRLEVETFSAFEFREGELNRLGGTCGARDVERLSLFNSCEDSLGQLYELITAQVGFHPLEAGKTMGLAAWGRPRFKDLFMEYMTIGKKLEEVFTFDPFDRGFQEALARAVADERGSFAVRADLAATVQDVFEDVLFAFYGMVEDLDFEVLCLSGGCALNSVANGALATRLPAERRLVVPPCAGDTGVGLGALWLEAQESGLPQISIRGGDPMLGVSRPGPRYEVVPGAAIENLDLDQMTVDPAVDTPEAVAGLLAQGLIIGVFNGPSEIGPRALGGRSILADPRRFELKEKINREIKKREPFRPLAPIILASAYERYFEPSATANPFMLIVAQATEECRRVAPGTVHVDGTARVQAVPAEGDAFLIALLEEFERLTGLPMLLNTSFNGRGEPIVETQEDAIEAFLALKLDGLWLENHFLRPM